MRSFLFWLLILAIGGYLFKIYLNDHPELVEWLKGFRPIRLFIQLWQHLLNWLRAGLSSLPRELISFGEKEEEAGVDSNPSWFERWRARSARERILYYYLNILKRSEKYGPGRRPHQTPYEYELELSQTLPEAEPAIEILTDAFVRARYSQESFHEEHANLAKALWQQIKKALGQHKSGQSSQ
jgi:hypothetical protein